MAHPRVHTRVTIPSTDSATILDGRGIIGVFISVSRYGSREERSPLGWSLCGLRPVPGGWVGVGEAVKGVFVEEELHTDGRDMPVLPHYAPAHPWYAMFLLAVQDEAFEQLRRTIRLDLAACQEPRTCCPPITRFAVDLA